MLFCFGGWKPEPDPKFPSRTTLNWNAAHSFGVEVAVGVGLGVGLLVGVKVGVLEGVGLLVGVAVGVSVGVGDAVGVFVGVAVGVLVPVGVALGVGVLVQVGVGQMINLSSTAKHPGGTEMVGRGVPVGRAQASPLTGQSACAASMPPTK